MEYGSKPKAGQTILLSETGQLTAFVSEEVIKNEYICTGATPEELARKFNLPVASMHTFISENKLDVLRAAHIKHGLTQLQNVQLHQAEKLMTLDNQFKKMRLLQIEKMLEDFMAYYSKHSHFYKVHPNTLEILKDTNGMPIQIKLPNVSSEIASLKEAVSLSEGLKQMLGHIDSIINTPKDTENAGTDVIDVTQYNELFKKKSDEDT